MVNVSRVAALALVASMAPVKQASDIERRSSTEFQSLDSALERLAADGRFSGAIVVVGADGVRFAKGYGPADPGSGRAFTPDTPVDSASLAKPVTAATVLKLVREGSVALDAPVRRYLPAYPHGATTVGQLLAHSAGLPGEETLEPLANKTNEMLLHEVADRRLPLLFEPGQAFTYCNLCYSTLALLIERVSGDDYLSVARKLAALPAGVTIRPRRLADWSARAIGYRRTAAGTLERADSYDDEAFYGSANLSISAVQLAEWGAQWWTPRLADIATVAKTPARIDGHPSGLTWGSWYCAPDGRRCHYLGHHEGFHHMLYWDADRRRSIAMVSNHTLAPALQQRLQRAVAAFAEGRRDAGARELSAELPDNPVMAGSYRLSTGETVRISSDGDRVSVERHGIRYPAYRIGAGIRYVPGLDTYLSGAREGVVHWLNLYEDLVGERQ